MTLVNDLSEVKKKIYLANNILTGDKFMILEINGN